MMMHFDLAQTAPAAPAPVPCQDASFCQRCDVRARAICGTLEEDDRAALNRLGRRVTVQAGQTVMWEGDDATIVANVIEGTLKLSASTGDGREQIVGVVYPSDFIGRPFGRSTPHSVTALTDARLCLFTRGAFDGFARTHPELGHRLLQRTLDDLDRARAWMLLLGRKNAREKIATFLLDMSQRLAGEGAGPLDSFALPLSRQQVADVLGLTIETVSRQMTDMKRAKIIDLPNRRTVEILDRDQLSCLAEVA
ncbi:Crp/Fnr family transcriptional regulator [Sphingobium xenophagum]|uniref:CRP/FNR family transcriptional regulator, anaerobic regulatory protein n=1 Tax=Sphingobium xenophagum TaxID=121428 RepID=A0A401J3U2_SPHXE|nr:Crp/Fnr family transcriptional regulator [Sphingobium xenophagum]GBH31319.1 CRP/FNR family transcriptional regulator, anaerobic regulatory protein [Sphingobium xenophagum]